MQCVLCRWKAPAITRNAIRPSVAFAVRQSHAYAQPYRAFASATSRLYNREDAAIPPPSASQLDKRVRNAKARPKQHSAKADAKTTRSQGEDEITGTEREQWQIQKAALKEKFGKESWNPRKRLSPDTIEGIRVMHASDPERFTTPVLAENFKVSPEVIRRILKSKWKPNPEEQEERRERWERRGERVWSQMAEMGLKPPKAWRVRGVGKAEPGTLPMWKRRGSRERSSETLSTTTVRRGLVAEKAPSAVSPAGNSSGGSILDRLL